MKAWESDEIRRATKGKWLMRGDHTAAGANAPETRRFSGRICTDSRKATPGNLFICINGKNHDAHTFIQDILNREPAILLVHRELAPDQLALAKERGVSVILVDDTILALNRLAAAYRNETRAKVIAVGGSNGKTTTKRIIHTLLTEKFGPQNGHASPKSFNNNIRMPLTLREVEPSHDYGVLEIGTNAPGEIAALGEVCRPDIAVITSVGLEHLEKLGDLEGVAREEASIASYVAEGGTLVLPADAPELLEAVKTTRAQRILVGRVIGDQIPMTNEFGADFVLTQLHESIDGTTFSINGRGSFKLPLLGEHNAMNALMAIAVARRLGVSDEQIAAGLAKVKPAEGRLEIIKASAFSVIDDSYNANPSSMEAALKTFAHLAPSTTSTKHRKVVILADMLELGPASEALHRSIGAMVAAWEFDLFIAIGPAMHFAADVAQAADIPVARFADTASARKKILQLLKTGDHLLLKGSRGMALETLLPALHQSASTPVAAPSPVAT